MKQGLQQALQLIRAVLNQVAATKQQHIDIDAAYKVIVDELEKEEKK